MQVMTILRALPVIAVLQAGMMALPAQAADEIRVGFPEVFSATGQRRERFDAAIARELCQSIGKPCRTVEINTLPAGKDLLEGRVDVLVSYFDSISRDDRIAGTRDYARMPLAFVVRKDAGLSEISPAALAGKKIAVGDMVGKSFVTTRLPRSVPSPRGDFLNALASGDADLAVARLDLAVYEIDMASGESCCKVVEVLHDVASINPNDRVLVRKSDKALKGLVDKTIGEMERGGKIKAAAMATFGFDVSPEAESENPHFPTAPEASRDIEPAIAERVVKLVMPRSRCSGLLVNGRAVLTAAHCVANAKSVVTVKPRAVTLYQNEKKLARKVSRIIIHPDYRALTSQDVGSSDIALLLLADDGPTLPPLSFLTGREAFLATDMMEPLFIDAALYGYGNRDRKDARLLKSRARLSLMVGRPDSFLGQSEKIFVKSREFCAGDSGGGVFLAPGGVVSADEPPLLLGIASTTGAAKELCDDAGEIIRTDFFAEWMAATLKEHGAD
jgi:polar amino acid transport system substrate-binding protein